MKQIIEGKLYDTDKMTEIYSAEFPGPTFWKSKKGTYIRKGFGSLDDNYLSVVTEDYFKAYLARTDIDKYIELYGEVEEG